MLRFRLRTLVHISIRVAVDDADGEAIIGGHQDVVRETARPYYTSDVLDAWAVKGSPEDIDRMRCEIRDETMVVPVAEVNGGVIGFGMLIPDEEKVRAVYVRPDYGRQGVGTAILKHLRDVALTRGVLRLELQSSLNAEAFYARQGYEVLERTVHRLSAGQEMACVRMTKSLSAI